MRVIGRILSYLLCMAASSGLTIAFLLSDFFEDDTSAKTVITTEVQRGVAVHESGHALIDAYFEGGKDIYKIVVYSKLPHAGYFGTVPDGPSAPKLDTRADIMKE